MQDLVIANETSNSFSYLAGNGDGSFLDRVNYPLDPLPYSVAAEDFDGDGSLDLALAVSSTNWVQIMSGTGDGGFQYASQFSVGSMPHFVVTGDFNGDGRPDLAVANSGSTTVSVLLNDTPMIDPLCTWLRGSNCYR
jgi:hypothetical protein